MNRINPTATADLHLEEPIQVGIGFPVHPPITSATTIFPDVIFNPTTP
jgi:hypothetical protein